MEQPSGTVEEMGAKPSLAGSGRPRSGAAPSPVLERVRAAYEGGDAEAAGELIQQACCGECSAGIHHHRVQLLSLATRHGDQKSVRFLLKEAGVAVPQEPTSSNPAILAAHLGHAALVKELLDSLPAVSLRTELLNSMLATSCQQGHLDTVRLLVNGYGADVEDCASQGDDFAVLTGLPLYAAAQAGNEDVANFLLQRGAGFSSYTLLDFPGFSRHLLRLRLEDTPGDGGQQNLSLCWTGLRLPWLDLDWFLDVSSRITHLDLSSNSLAALPSVVPWGLIHLRTLDLSNNNLKELPFAENSQDVICSSLQQANLSQNQLKSLPTGLLHLTHMQKLFASKNQLAVLFDVSTTVNWIGLRKLEELDVSDNCLASLPTAVVHCLKSLCSLDVSRNRLSCFPEPWACPLKQCKAPSNVIEALPSSISVSWRSRLQEVDFSDNCLKEIPSYIFELEKEEAKKPPQAISTVDSSGPILAAIANQSTELAKVCTLVDDLKKSLEGRLDSIETCLSSLQKEHRDDMALSTTDGRVSALEATCKELMEANGRLKAKVNDLEGRSRRLNVRIVGIKEGEENGRPT
ncbi:leucine-rich repeat serine/threonine-protein kinase 1-like [Cololabis saira]|uniref:leucine-rich repeat serine/threonine-protein kinase 1-like n=1 Tax=Cololabis saira TaxID=129043 RepID=UPI002AD29B20|nr:leucine-rich repeat serine/threonine-protein kinase 1-like [Cololabis saira]